jgi:CBS domain containing-hemolysin-like protein
VSFWQDVLPWLPAMATLIVLSAFFSGSEAALFSLRPRDRRALARGTVRSRRSSGGRSAGGQAALTLLENPSRLLSAVLFWNLLVNMAYFAIASIVGGRLEAQNDRGAAIAFTLASLLTIIFFSEMLPKSVAVLAPARIAQAVGQPLTWAIRLLDPLLPIVEGVNVVVRRLLWPSFQAERELEVSDIERAIELGTGDAVLAERERGALQQLIQLSDTRVNEWMRPRSQVRLYRPPIRRETLAQGLPPDGYLMIAEPDSEEVTASIALRQLRPAQLDHLAAAAEPVLYVPWAATVAHVFDALRENDRQVAAVVNEYGETIGVVTIDDILQGVLCAHASPLAGSDSVVERLSEGVWRVSGLMSVRRLARLLEGEMPEGRNVTVAGLMQGVNRRLPRIGDRCPWGAFELEVVSSAGPGQLLIEVRRVDSEEPPA